MCFLQLLACIGEQFDEGDEICGIVVNLRARQDRLCVWTKTAHNEAAQVLIHHSWAVFKNFQTASASDGILSMCLYVCNELAVSGQANCTSRLPFQWNSVMWPHPTWANLELELQVSIARQLKDFLDVPEGNKLGFLPHVSLAFHARVFLL